MAIAINKFDLFLNDDLTEAEPEQVIKKISEDKKRKELAYKEAKKQKHNEIKKIVSKKVLDKEVSNLENKHNNEKTITFQKSENKTVFKPKNVGQDIVIPMSKSEVNDIPKERSESFNPKRHSATKKVKGREFDRHSGSDKTGIKSIERRDGTGAYNWGNVKDLVDLSEESKEEVADEKNVPDTEKNEPEIMMTIREWKALQISKNVISMNVPSRSANNGENVFTGMNPYKKNDAQHLESENDFIFPDDESGSKKRRPVNVQIEFNSRCRRNREYNPQFRNNETSVAVKDPVLNLDEDEFPTLS